MPQTFQARQAERLPPGGGKPVSVVAKRLAPIFIGLLLTSCGNGSEDSIHVSLRFSDANPAHVLTDVRVIVGDEKFWWPNIQGGESETVTLKPDPQSERELVLFYTLAGQEMVWSGLKFGMGRQGYRARIVIDEKGQVYVSHCPLPCGFD